MAKHSLPLVTDIYFINEKENLIITIVLDLRNNIKTGKGNTTKGFYINDTGKGGFFSESAMKFFQISKSQKKIFQKAILSLKLNFLPITVKCYWREI